MRTKVLAGLCAVFFLVAAIEAVLLIREHREQTTIAAHDPFRAMRQITTPNPWSHFHDRFFGDFDDDALFKDFGHDLFERFRRRHSGAGLEQSFGRQFTGTFSFMTPKWEVRGGELRMIMNIKGHEKGDYSVDITDSQVILTAKDRVAKDDQGLSEESHWSSTQSFPLPVEADPKSFRVDRTSDEFIVIFKKRESGRTST